MFIGSVIKKSKLESLSPSRFLFQPDVFRSFCWPAELIGRLRTRQMLKEFDRCSDIVPFCIVGWGGVPNKYKHKAIEFGPVSSPSLWLEHGLVARKMASACAQSLASSALYGGINLVHVLAPHLILKILPLLNFLNSFQEWCKPFEGRRVKIAASPTMLEVLQALTEKWKLDVEWIRLTLAELIQNERERYYRPVRGWCRWHQATNECANIMQLTTDALFTVCPGSPSKIVRRLVEFMSQDKLLLTGVTVEGAQIRDLPMKVYEPLSGGPLSRHRLDFSLIEQIHDHDTVFRNIFNYDGVSLWPLMKPVLQSIIKTRVSAVAQAIDGFNEIFEQLKPKILVVSNNSVWLDRAAILVARQAGIPSLATQDGDYQLVWPWEILSDKIAVQGDQSRRVLEAFGVTTSKIEITGQVRYDHFTAGRENSKTRQKVRERLRIERPYLAVVATDPGSLTHTLSQKQADETYVVEEMAGQSEWDLVFKLHPQDNGAITRNVTRDRPKIRVISNEFSAEELIDACDIWIATASTTAVEAVIVGRSVALLNHAGGNFMSDLVASGVAGYVGKPGDLQFLVERILSSGSTDSGFLGLRETFIQDRLYRLDGNATARVVGLIDKMRTASLTPCKD